MTYAIRFWILSQILSCNTSLFGLTESSTMDQPLGNEPHMFHSLTPASFLLLSDSICVVDEYTYLMECIYSGSRQTSIDYKKWEHCNGGIYNENLFFGLSVAASVSVPSGFASVVGTGSTIETSCCIGTTVLEVCQYYYCCCLTHTLNSLIGPLESCKLYFDLHLYVLLRRP